MKTRVQRLLSGLLACCLVCTVLTWNAEAAGVCGFRPPCCLTEEDGEKPFCKNAQKRSVLSAETLLLNLSGNVDCWRKNHL